MRGERIAGGLYIKKSSRATLSNQQTHIDTITFVTNIGNSEARLLNAFGFQWAQPSVLDSKPARTPTLFSEPQCLITQFGVYVYCLLFPDYCSVPLFPSTSTSTFFALPSHSHDSRLNRTHWPRSNCVFIPYRVMIGALILFGTGLQLDRISTWNSISFGFWFILTSVFWPFKGIYSIVTVELILAAR